MKRIRSLDILRIIAAMGVVMIHVSSRGLMFLEPSTTDFTVAYCFDAFSRFAVPFFLMISGALFLNKDREIKPVDLWCKNILRLFVIYIIWVAVYSMPYYLGEGMHFSPSSVLDLLTTPKYHLWYIPTIIGIYAITPFLNTWIKAATKKEIELYILLFSILCLLKNTLILLDISYSFNKLLGIIDFNTFYIHLSYYILGYYLYTYGLFQLKKKVLALLWIAPLIINIGYGVMLSRKNGFFTPAIFDIDSITTFISVAAFFVLIKDISEKLSISEKGDRAIALLSKDTLGIYLVHIFIIEYFAGKWFSVDLGRQIITIPLFFIFVVLISAAFSALARRIPFVGKYIC